MGRAVLHSEPYARQARAKEKRDGSQSLPSPKQQILWGNMLPWENGYAVILFHGLCCFKLLLSGLERFSEA